MLLSGFGWGMFFGILYFGGLWLTVRSVSIARNPNKYLLKSFLVRIFLLMAAIWFVSDPNHLILFPLMAGILTIRHMMFNTAQQGCTRRENAPQP